MGYFESHQAVHSHTNKQIANPKMTVAIVFISLRLIQQFLLKFVELAQCRLDFRWELVDWDGDHGRTGFAGGEALAARDADGGSGISLCAGT